jgi:PTH1 family peptidyl-tRNA hydrolase
VSTTRRIALIVALGNPGDKYEATRHNAGVWLLEAIRHAYGGVWAPAAAGKAHVANALIEEQAVKLLRPRVYMNVNGAEIAKYMRYFKLDASQILVLHDEMDFPPGVVRLKDGGGCAGHNGLKSLKAHLGTTDFLRLRIGIGHPGHQDLVSDYVLAKPSVADHNHIMDACHMAEMQIPAIVSGQIQAAMRILHPQ